MVLALLDFVHDELTVSVNELASGVVLTEPEGRAVDGLGQAKESLKCCQSHKLLSRRTCLITKNAKEKFEDFELANDYSLLIWVFKTYNKRAHHPKCFISDSFIFIVTSNAHIPENAALDNLHCIFF